MPSQTQALAKKDRLPAPLVSLIQGVVPDVPALLPPDIAYEQFRAALWLELISRPALHDCTMASLRDCIIRSATYGLLPGRDVHFLPFKDKHERSGQRRATWVPNYFGILRELERSNKVRRAFAQAVYTRDVFEVDYFADRPIHKPVIEGDRGKLRCFYGCIILKDGSCNFEVMTLEQIDAIRRRAPAHDEGPWVTDFEMMGRKTALKRVAKYVKLTPRQQEMFEAEDAREREDIPEARHRQNIVDLFGKEPDPTDDAPPLDIDPATGEIIEEKGTKPAPQKKASTPAREDKPIWYETLTKYANDARLPEELKEQLDFALSPMAAGQVSDSEGHALAEAVLRCVEPTVATGEGR